MLLQEVYNNPILSHEGKSSPVLLHEVKISPILFTCTNLKVV